MAYGRFGHECYPWASEASECLAAGIRQIHRWRLEDGATQVWLVVGRGTPHGSQELQLGAKADPGECHRLVYCDHFGGAFRRPNEAAAGYHCHLWVNVCHPETLALPLHGLFDHIVFDASTARYMSLSGVVVSTWRRLLTPGGSLYFESAIASVTYAWEGTGVEQHNPCHVVVPLAELPLLLAGRPDADVSQLTAIAMAHMNVRRTFLAWKGRRRDDCVTLARNPLDLIVLPLLQKRVRDELKRLFRQHGFSQVTECPGHTYPLTHLQFDMCEFLHVQV